MSDEPAEESNRAAPVARPLKLIWRLWVGLLSLVYPGLGQAVRGAYRRGVWFAVASIVALLVFTQSIYGWLLLPSAITFVLVWVLSGLTFLAVFFWAAIDAFRFRQNRNGRLSRWWMRWPIYAGFVMVLGTRQFLLGLPHWEPFSIPSSSMEPTVLVGDYILTINRYYENRAPERGELVVFGLPRDPSVDFFKRVVGLPGDRIQMKKGVLLINDLPISRTEIESYEFTGNLRREKYRQFREALPNGINFRTILLKDEDLIENTEVFIVPAGHIFVLGDNRDNSVDSRYVDGDVGFLPSEKLKARAALVYFSTNGLARWWQVWKWPQAIRWERIGLKLE